MQPDATGHADRTRPAPAATPEPGLQIGSSIVPLERNRSETGTETSGCEEARMPMHSPELTRMG